jgi:magnesium chelatase family protein
MSLATVRSRALLGLQAPPVHVEVQLANGLPSFTLVGLADTEVKEARERVRAAVVQSGFAFPHNQRITVSLAPADLPKESGRFDLPIALGILAASGQLPAARLAGLEFAGELSLAGELRPVRGALALALAVRAEFAATTVGAPAVAAASRLVLPWVSARSAAQVSGLDVRGAHTLAEVAAALMPAATDHAAAGPAGESAWPAQEPCAFGLPRAEPWPATPPAALPDLLDVKGQGTAKRALEIAAAGGHSLLLLGPPGTGKSMLAQRLPGLLPPLTEDEALAAAALADLASLSNSCNTPAGARLQGGRPLRAPHHTASAAALVGGGSPPRPGEISLAHGGVLFLDELPEFPRRALEALREPLECGHVTISRAARQAVFPAAFQLIAAMNPCPCGWHGAPPGLGRSCRCTPDAVARYQGRLSGPLLDRIDLQVEVLAARPAELLAAPAGEPSVQVAARVAAARDRSLARQGCVNAALAAAALDHQVHLDSAASRLVQQAADRLAWSGRRLHRALRVARTIADLADAPNVGVCHVAEALQLQRALMG